jgi:hypothetical protein
VVFQIHTQGFKRDKCCKGYKCDGDADVGDVLGEVKYTALLRSLPAAGFDFAEEDRKRLSLIQREVILDALRVTLFLNI